MFLKLIYILYFFREIVYKLFVEYVKHIHCMLYWLSIEAESRLIEKLYIHLHNIHIDYDLIL